MAKTQIHVMVSEEVRERIRKFQTEVADSTKTNVSESAAAAALILRGLEQVGRRR